MIMPFLTRSLVPLALLALAACSGVPGFQDPPRLHTLTPATRFTEELPRVERQLLVEAPMSAAGLDSSRIALRTAPTSLDYFAGVNWTDRAPAMIQTLIVESLENSDRIVSVGRDTVGLRADWLLKTDLRGFQAEYEGAPGLSAPNVRVRINAKLVAMPGRTIEASRNFEAVVPAASSSFDAVIAAYDAATNEVLRQLVEWTLTSVPGRS